MTNRPPLPTPDSTKAFTTTFSGRARALTNEVEITEAFDPQTTPTPSAPLHRFKAIWDTGATNSVITQNVVDHCGLVATGMARTHTAGGVHDTETYLVGILLPDRVGFPQVRVSKGALAGADVLIGMDIIGTGDFAVTNYEGNTVFTFRIPSSERIDFVQSIRDENNRNTRKVGRNDPCPCGSGKKFKRCHGR